MGMSRDEKEAWRFIVGTKANELMDAIEQVEGARYSFASLYPGGPKDLEPVAGKIRQALGFLRSANKIVNSYTANLDRMMRSEAEQE